MLGDIDELARLLTIRGRHGRGTKAGNTQETAKKKAKVGWEVRPLMAQALAVLREKRGIEFRRRTRRLRATT